MPRRLVLVVAVVALAVPASATAKQGAIFNPQLFDLRSGSATRLELYVLPVYRGTVCIASSTCPSPPPTRVLVSAPRVGSIPIVTLRLLGGRTVVRFRGTPLDRDRRSLVTLLLPRSHVVQRWAMSVRADGRAYPDVTDAQIITVSAGFPPAPAARLSASGPGHGGGATPWWLFGVTTVVALACGFMLVSRGRHSDRRWPGRA